MSEKECRLTWKNSRALRRERARWAFEWQFWTWLAEVGQNFELNHRFHLNVLAHVDGNIELEFVGSICAGAREENELRIAFKISNMAL